MLLSQILEEMITVDKRNVSTYKRKHQSASDDRPSSQSIGCVAVILLVVNFGGIILLDLPRLHRDMRDLIQNLREK